MTDVDENPPAIPPETDIEDTSDGEKNPIIFAIAIGAAFVGIVVLTACILVVVHSSRERKKRVCARAPLQPNTNMVNFVSWLRSSISTDDC